MIAVVGGGFAGLSAAYHLAREGRQVALFESGELGGESSGRNTGLLGPGAGGPIGSLVRRYGRLSAARLFEATLDAVADVRALIRDERLACDLETNGQLVVARTERQARALEAQAETFTQLGFRVPWLDRAALARRLGSGLYRGALHHPTAANLDPHKLVAELARVVRARGVEIRTHTPVREIELGLRVRLALEGGSVVAEKVVLATDAFTPRLGFLRGRVVPLHTHVLATEPLAPAVVASLGWAGREGIVDARRFFNYFRLTAEDRLLFGGGVPRYAAARDDRSAGSTRLEDPRQWRRLERELAAVFPQLSGVPIERRWAGVMGFTLDRLPVVGELVPGVIHAGAWCGHGLALSIASGAVVADLVAGRPSRWAHLPWSRTTAPWLPPDPLRAAGLGAYLATLGAADRIDSLRGQGPAPAPTPSPLQGATP